MEFSLNKWSTSLFLFIFIGKTNAKSNILFLPSFCYGAMTICHLPTKIYNVSVAYFYITLLKNIFQIFRNCNFFTKIIHLQKILFWFFKVDGKVAFQQQNKTHKTTKTSKLHFALFFQWKMNEISTFSWKNYKKTKKMSILATNNNV